LPGDILDAEIALIEKLGVEFRCRTRVGDSISLGDLRRDFDAIFIAVGRLEEGGAGLTGIQTKSDTIVIDNRTYQTNLPGVFAGGDAVRRRKLTVRAVADGKEAAESISQYLNGEPVTGPDREFNTRIGKLSAEEVKKFLPGHSDAPQTKPSGKDGGFSEQEVIEEAGRCLHCDCRKPESCKLRKYAHNYNAKAGQYKSERRSFVQFAEHPEIIFEPGKCINCGLCVQIVARAGEELGLTFIGRGFDARVAVPFGKKFAEAVKQTKTAEKCVNACPTGALAFKHSDE
jgi:NADPH-dependent glutamate synthase beta subunit-like oxidoreductase